MVKALLMNAAATLTAAVMENLPDNLPVDPDATHPDLQGANLQASRVCAIFYDFLVRAHDSDVWKNPSSAGLPDSALAGLLDHPVIKAILEKLAAKV